MSRIFYYLTFNSESLIHCAHKMAMPKNLPGEDFKEMGLWHFNDF